jgi:hypothetical protein
MKKSLSSITATGKRLGEFFLELPVDVDIFQTARRKLEYPAFCETTPP